MSQITIGGTTLNFKDSAFTGDQWEQVASWVLNGGAEGIDANAQIATEKAAAASASAASARNSATSAGESATAAANSASVASSKANDAITAASDAQAAKNNAADSQTAAKQSEDNAAASATSASNSAASASSSATAAANSAASAAESIKHAPRINSNGKWELWDATTNAYVATEYTSIGEDGVRGRGWYQHDVITSLVQSVVWDGSIAAPKWGEGDWLYNPDNGNVGICTSRTDNADGSGYANITYKGTLKGADGSSIQSIERTSGTGAPGTTDTYTVTLTNGDTTTFQVYNGKDGSGSGDMTKAVYDPKGKAQDIFSYADTKYSKPSGGIPKKDLASDVQTSLGKADSALQSAPVTSVNSKTGAVNLAKGDVGLGNVDNVKQYSASNPPPYPVTSVNGKTGEVTVSIPTVPSTTSLIKGNGSGGLVAATLGSDYIASGNIVKQTLVATETTPTENYAINWVYG